MSKQKASIDAVHLLKQFRAFLITSQEEIRGALSDADSDLRRTKSWLESDQVDYWKGMYRKAERVLQQAKNDLRRKELAPTSNGKTPTAIEERKAVQKAQAQMQHAQEKLLTIKRSYQILEKASQQYRSAVQRLAQNIEGNIPRAAVRLDHQIDALEKYLAVGQVETVGSQVDQANKQNMRRSVEIDNTSQDKSVEDDEGQAELNSNEPGSKP